MRRLATGTVGQMDRDLLEFPERSSAWSRRRGTHHSARRFRVTARTNRRTRLRTVFLLNSNHYSNWKLQNEDG